MNKEPKYKVDDNLIVDKPHDIPLAQRRKGMVGLVAGVGESHTAPFEFMYYIAPPNDMDHWFYESELSMVKPLTTIITNTEALRVTHPTTSGDD